MLMLLNNTQKCWGCLSNKKTQSEQLYRNDFYDFNSDYKYSLFVCKIYFTY